MPLARTVLYTGEILSIRYVSCRSADKRVGDIEYSEGNNLILPLRGVFLEHFSSSQQVLAEPNVALLFPAGRPSRISHPLAAEDDCLVMQFAPEVFQQIMETAETKDVGTHCMLAPPAMGWRNLLWRRIERGLAGQLEIEESGLAFLNYALRHSSGNRDMVRRKSIKASRQVEMARLALLENPELKWTLTELAKKVASSPFHLTRMFHKQVGAALHRYQLRTRLARAIDLLLDTRIDITTIALDLGFSSHSHFTASFRQMIGLPPLKFRETVRSVDATKIRKILIAGLKPSA